MLLHLFVQPLAFTAQDDRGGQGIRDLVIGFRAALVQPVDPVAPLFQIFEGAIDVGDARHRQVLDRARRGFCRHVRQAGRAALGDDDAACAGRVRGADHRAEVVRVLHAIEHDQQLGPRHLFELGILARRAHRDHALVRRTSCQPVERRPWLEAHRHARAPRQVDQFLQTWAARALRHQQPLQRMFGAQRLGHRVDSAQDRHHASG